MEKDGMENDIIRMVLEILTDLLFSFLIFLFYLN